MHWDNTKLEIGKKFDEKDVDLQGDTDPSQDLDHWPKDPDPKIAKRFGSRLPEVRFFPTLKNSTLKMLVHIPFL